MVIFNEMMMDLNCIAGGVAKAVKYFVVQVVLLSSARFDLTQILFLRVEINIENFRNAYSGILDEQWSTILIIAMIGCVTHVILVIFGRYEL